MLNDTTNQGPKSSFIAKGARFDGIKNLQQLWVDVIVTIELHHVSTNCRI